MFIRRVVGQREVGKVRAELLESGFTFCAGAVGVHHAPTAARSPPFEFGDSRADLGELADDFVAGNAGVNSGHSAAPLVANLTEIGVADAAVKNFNLYTVFGWIAARDRGRGQERCRTGSSVSFRVVQGTLPVKSRNGRACPLSDLLDARPFRQGFFYPRLAGMARA